MPIIASAKGGGDFPKVPAGSHAARCYQIIDLGTQEIEWQGKKKLQRKLWITWEIPEETIEINGENKPMAISRMFTLSLAETGALLPFLESWRGKRFSEEELSAFDVAKLLGKPCLLSVVHDTKNGKEYANISAIAVLPRGMKCADQVNPSVEYSIDEGYSPTFKALPEFLQKKIEASEEFKKLNGDSDDPGFVPDHERGNGAIGVPEDEDIPFHPNHL